MEHLKNPLINIGCFTKTLACLILLIGTVSDTSLSQTENSGYKGLVWGSGVEDAVKIFPGKISEGPYGADIDPIWLHYIVTGSNAKLPETFLQKIKNIQSLKNDETTRFYFFNDKFFAGVKELDADEDLLSGVIGELKKRYGLWAERKLLKAGVDYQTGERLYYQITSWKKESRLILVGYFCTVDPETGKKSPFLWEKPEMVEFDENKREALRAEMRNASSKEEQDENTNQQKRVKAAIE